ncbi:MAG: hypothetical protein GY809_11970, partial [Planctomycetes bacterium]|nr:hypothetical protein [Planctomycetota bacterium]
LYGMLVLAALATVELVEWLTDRKERVVVWVLLVSLGVISPLAQAMAQNFVYDADQTNPYVYAHTHRDIFDMSEQLHRLVRCAPAGEKPVIQVVCPGKDYWPLPWYMRDYDQIGYSSQVDMNEPPGDVILFQPAMAADVGRLLLERFPKHELYVGFSAERLWLRPGVPLDGYLRFSLSEAARSDVDE